MTHEAEQDEVKQCPFCAEVIKRKAIVCRHCKSELVLEAENHSVPPRTIARALQTGPDENHGSASGKFFGLGLIVIVLIGLGVLFHRQIDGLFTKKVPPATDIRKGNAIRESRSTAVAEERSSSLINNAIRLANDSDFDSVSEMIAELGELPKPKVGNVREGNRLNQNGLKALKEKNFPKAAQAFALAAKADPSVAKYLSNLGFAEMNNKSLVDAEKHIRQSICLSPSRSVAWDDLGLVFAKAGDQQKAIGSFLVGYHKSDDKSLDYLNSLLKDPDPSVRTAGDMAAEKASQYIMQMRAAPQSMPINVGDTCVVEITEITTRLEGSPDSGDLVRYANGGYQVSYEKIPGLADAQVGDYVELCLIELPKQPDGSPCPPGDNRGSVYRATNLRTKKSWVAPDSEHSCGGP